MTALYDRRTYDFLLPTTTTTPHTHRCQAPACRGTVTSLDWQLPAIQQRYWPHFPPFVKRLILEAQHMDGGNAEKGVIPEEHRPANGAKGH